MISISLFLIFAVALSFVSLVPEDNDEIDFEIKIEKIHHCGTMCVKKEGKWYLASRDGGIAVTACPGCGEKLD